MPIIANTGRATVSIASRRPSWADMRKYYPDGEVSSPDLFDQIGGPFPELYKLPGYKNTCAVRLSFALNKSAVKLGEAPRGGSRKGGDGLTYWFRVDPLTEELTRRFKAPDFELSFTMIPASQFKNNSAMSALFKKRVKEGQAFIDTKIKNKKGIIVFEVTGWPDATGHFTLWDGSAGKLIYAPDHDNPINNMYYFWLTKLIEDDKGTFVLQVEKIKFWELK